MVMPSQVTWYCYTKVWVRLYDGQLLSTERVGYSWSVMFTWDAQNVTLLCIEDHLPGEISVVESGNILLEWCTITGRPDLPVEDQLSANKRISEEILFAMSLTYRRNSRGPSTVPWGTPDSIGIHDDCVPFSTTMMKSMLWFFHEYRDGPAVTVTDGVGRNWRLSRNQK